MTDTPEPYPERTEAEVHRGRWPGIVWALPIAALLIAAWLLLRALTHMGVDATLTVDNAEGVRTGDTHVTYQGLEIGHVSAIRLADDNRHVVLTLKIDSSKKDLLREGTTMWVLGANPTFTNIASLRAAVAGPSIGIDPGQGAPKRDFVAVDSAPVVTSATPGRHFRLIATDLISITPGTKVYTHGVEAGTIVSIKPTGQDGFLVDAFVRAPYAKLVTTASHFWDANAFQITRTAGGLQARLTSPSIAALGGVIFETPPQLATAQPAAEGARFKLYGDAGSAAAAPVGPETRYQLALSGDVGGLEPGAPVQLRGFTVGRVIDKRFVFDDATGTIRTPVTIAIDGTRLNVAPTRDAVDRVMDGLARHGLRAELSQSPPFVGAYLVNLNPKGGAPTRLAQGSPYPYLPTVPGGGGDLMSKADSILTKVDQLPLAEIGGNLRAITGNLKSLTGSPALKDSLTHLDSTLTTLDRTAKQTAPKIGPLIASLQATADQAQQAAGAAAKVMGANGGGQDAELPAAIRQLTEAARNIRSLTDYLSRHPEALLRGRKEQK